MIRRTHVRIDFEAIRTVEAHQFVADENCGAVASFLGVTRRDILDRTRQVVALEFEAHVQLAEAVLNQIITRHRDENPELAHVFIHHRIGTVPVGDANVVIAVSSPHRKSAFRAVQALMDELKARLPVWKKERFSDDSYRWQENVEFRPD